MSSPASERVPRLAVACDVAVVVCAAAAAWLALTGSHRSLLGGVALTITWAHALFAGAAIAAIRHAAMPAPSLVDTLHVWSARVRTQPALADAVLAFWLTRPLVLAIGFVAVVTLGLPAAAPESAGGRHVWTSLPSRFDANWYAGIALEGYEWQHQFDAQQNFAFFPAYPLLMRAAGAATGVFREGLPPERQIIALTWCGLMISLAAFFWAVWYFARLAGELLDRDRARMAVLLLAAYPFALFYSAAYSEALFLLAAVGAWYHMRHGELARSAAWALLAGLARPPGFLLSIPLGLIALGVRDASEEPRSLSQGSRGPGLRNASAELAEASPASTREAKAATPARTPQRAQSARRGPRLLRSAASAFAEASADRRSLGGGWSRLARAAGAARVAVAAMPGIGMLLFTAYLYHLTGVWFAWARIHGAWGRVFSDQAPAGLVSGVSADGLLKLAADNPYNAMNALGLIFALALVVPVWNRVGPPWATYVLVSVLLPVFAGGLLSMGRLSSTLFPLFLALAAVLPVRSAPAVLVPFAMLQGLMAALFYTWRELL